MSETEIVPNEEHKRAAPNNIFPASSAELDDFSMCGDGAVIMVATKEVKKDSPPTIVEGDEPLALDDEDEELDSISTSKSKQWTGTRTETHAYELQEGDIELSKTDEDVVPLKNEPVKLHENVEVKATKLLGNMKKVSLDDQVVCVGLAEHDGNTNMYAKCNLEEGRCPTMFNELTCILAPIRMGDVLNSAYVSAL
jgi:hypothetical protein